MTHRATTVALAMLALASASGCGDDGRVDAGGDAGIDATAGDGGTEVPDAEADAGGDAGAPLGPITMARDEARTDTLAVESAAGALDPSLRSAEYARLDATLARLDAVIGEKGVIGPSLIDIAGVIGEKGTTLAFETPLAAVIVLVRELRAASLDLATFVAAIDTETDPDVVALHDASVALIASLTQLRMVLLDRYDVLAETSAALPGMEELAYLDRRPLHLAPDRTTVRSVIEASTASPTAAISVRCTGTLIPVINVFDDRDDTPLLEAAMGNGPHAITPPAGRPAMLRIDVLVAGALGDACTVDVEGRRHHRSAPIALSSTDLDDLGTRRLDWDSRMATLLGTIHMMRTEGLAWDMALAPIVEDYAREASAATGLWRSGPTAISPEDLDILTMTLERSIIPMSLALENGPELASTASRFGASVRTLLGELRAHDEAVLAILGRP